MVRQRVPPVNIEIAGPDFDEAAHLADEVKRLLVVASESGQIPGSWSTFPTRCKWVVRRFTSRSTASAPRSSASARSGSAISCVRPFREPRPRGGGSETRNTMCACVLREEDRSSPRTLENLTLRQGQMGIPLVAIADVYLDHGRRCSHAPRPRSRRHRECQHGRRLQQPGGAHAGAGLPRRLRAHPAARLPMRYTGEQQEQDEAFAFLTTALMIGVALIFFILIAQFNSVSSPLLIMIAVGLGLIGVLVGLIVTGTPFSLFTFIGRDLAGGHHRQQQHRAGRLHQPASREGDAATRGDRRGGRDEAAARHPDGSDHHPRPGSTDIRLQHRLRRAAHPSRAEHPIRFPEHTVLGPHGYRHHQRADVRNVPHACRRAGDLLGLQLDCRDSDQRRGRGEAAGEG